jgi:hypothetical protein
MSERPVPREIRGLSTTGIIYSFCTLVTDVAEYQLMISAFVSNGFIDADCEFLYIDNSAENRFDAYSGYNHFLQEAKGRYIILCHQDVLPNGHDRVRLDALLEQLSQHDPDWGLCGNAGATASGRYALGISDPNGKDMNAGGPFPARVISLDENFIVVRRVANLATSHNLAGYHWYGSDLCIIADLLGWHAYVIDFHLLHKSGGSLNRQFEQTGSALRRKYAHAFRSRRQYVITRRPVFISASPVKTLLVHSLWQGRSLLGKARRRLRKLVT